MTTSEEFKELISRIKSLDEVAGNYVIENNIENDEYLRGLANGLILAQSILYKETPKYIGKHHAKN